MNKKLQDLIGQSTYFQVSADHCSGISESSAQVDLEKFALLIIENCISACATDQLGKTVGAEDLINKRFGIEYGRFCESN
jgi:tyrosine-protein phosphatase YwqE